MPRTDRREILVHGAGLAGAIALDPSALLGRALSPRPEPVDLALIGVGKQGRAILGELHKIEAVRVAAICDTSESRLKAGLRRVPSARGYADHRRLLEEEPSLAAVLVATPTHLHREPCLDSLAAGKHVFCEAPLAASLEDCRAIAKAARSSPAAFHVGMQGRTNPIYGLARSFARAGAIRDVAGARAQFHRKTSWRTPVGDPSEERALNWVLDPQVSLGLVGELGTHQFDVAHWFFDAYPTRVRGGGSIQLHRDGREVFDTARCEIEFPGSRTLLWDATLANSYEGQYELFLGSMGAIRLAWTAGWLFKEADAPTQGWEVYANREQFHDEQGITLIADATKLAAQNRLEEGIGLPHPPLWYALEAFLRSALEAAPVACGVEEGLRAAAVAIRADQAIRSGGEVEIAQSDFEVG